jgi:hypothetical protein
MGATHFLTKTLPKVAAEMALAVLAYNLTRVMNIVGTKPLMVALAAEAARAGPQGPPGRPGALLHGQDPERTCVSRRLPPLRCCRSIPAPLAIHSDKNPGSGFFPALF